MRHDVTTDTIARLDPSRPVLLAGATASGKSALALRIAQAQSRAIVNADALQVYACWRILSARPTPEDERAVPHFLYGIKGFTQTYSVGAWLRDVAPHVQADPAPVIVGGTGLYFSALLDGLTDIPPIPDHVRAQGDALRQTAPQDMVADLRDRDPDTADAIDLANPMRVQRAWEVLQATGRGLRAWQRDTPPPLLAPDQAQGLVLHVPPAVLEDRLTRRFDAMLDQGALDEVRAVLPIWDPARPAARAIGAPELVAYLQGDLTLAQARDRAVIATRQYAKRQRTWFRSRFKTWDWLEMPMG